MLTTALCFLYLSMRPQPPNPAEGEAGGANQPLVEDPLGPTTDDGNVTVGAADADPDTEDTAEEGEPKADIPRQKIVLGSSDPNKGYELQLYLDNRGASLERAELVGRDADGRLKYRALENRGGYLGHLSLNEDAVIQCVPDGSPAANATSSAASGGLEIGDKITAVGGASLILPSSLYDNLSTTKDGDTIDLTVERNGKSLTFQVTLTEAPLDVIRTNERPAEFIAGNLPMRSLKTTLASLNTDSIPVGQDVFSSLKNTLDGNWQVSSLDVAGGEGVEFRISLKPFISSTKPGNIDLVKRYKIYPKSENADGFEVDFETVIENRNEEPITASLRQQGLVGLTLEGWWYSVKISPYMFSAAGQRDVIYNSPAAKHQLLTTRQIQDHAKDTPNQPSLMIFGEGEPVESRQLSYIGLDSQYFNASLLPNSNGDTPQAFRQAAAMAAANVANIHKNKLQATNTSFWLDTIPQEIPAGGKYTQSYRVYIGPKDTDILELETRGLGRSIEYGWFGWVAKPLSFILHFFHSLVGNYGIAIVMLTLLVRSLLFPFTRKAMINSQRMQERMKVLQPEMKKINDKYKDNMEKRAKAMQELYAKHNFNPAENLAGCLPMFFQLPVFMGLYRCLSVDISLRQEPLIQGIAWCSNLAGPDMFAEWSSWMPDFIAGKGNGWLGPYFNILPICTVVLFIVQQHFLMPKATDEQTRMTQNMMKVMTVFMGVLFFKVPSGLCIYFITSSIWSLFERQLIKRNTANDDNGPATSEQQDTKPDGGSSPNGSNGRRNKKNRNQPSEQKPKGKLEELREMLEKPAVKSSTQRGPAPKSKRDRKRRRR